MKLQVQLGKVVVMGLGRRNLAIGDFIAHLNSYNRGRLMSGPVSLIELRYNGG